MRSWAATIARPMPCLGLAEGWWEVLRSAAEPQPNPKSDSPSPKQIRIPRAESSERPEIRVARYSTHKLAVAAAGGSIRSASALRIVAARRVTFPVNASRPFSRTLIG